jgi:hypothetical protein
MHPPFPTPPTPHTPCRLLQVIGLWIVVLAPWKAVTYSDTAALQQTLQGLQRAADSRAAAAAARPGGGSSGGVSGGLGPNGHAGLFGGGVGGTLAASTAAKLNRWGSEMVQVAHTLSHGGERGEGADTRSSDGQVRGGAWGRSPTTTAEVNGGETLNVNGSTVV